MGFDCNGATVAHLALTESAVLVVTVMGTVEVLGGLEVTLVIKVELPLITGLLLGYVYVEYFYFHDKNYALHYLGVAYCHGVPLLRVLR